MIYFYFYVAKNCAIRNASPILWSVSKCDASSLIETFQREKHPQCNHSMHCILHNSVILVTFLFFNSLWELCALKYECLICEIPLVCIWFTYTFWQLFKDRQDVILAIVIRYIFIIILSCNFHCCYLFVLKNLRINPRIWFAKLMLLISPFVMCWVLV